MNLHAGMKSSSSLAINAPKSVCGARRSSQSQMRARQRKGGCGWLRRCATPGKLLNLCFGCRPLKGTLASSPARSCYSRGGLSILGPVRGLASVKASAISPTRAVKAPNSPVGFPDSAGMKNGSHFVDASRGIVYRTVIYGNVPAMKMVPVSRPRGRTRKTTS